MTNVNTQDEYPVAVQSGDGKTFGWTRLLAIAALMLFVGVSAIAVWRSAETPRGEAIAGIVGDDRRPGLLSDAHQPLGNVILASYREYRANTVRWSAAYFSCLFLSAVCSALAGFVIKVKALSKAAVLKEDLAALLAMVAALLITLSTVGDFQRKWQANRIAAAETEALVYELIRHDVDREAVITRLQEIGMARNQEITGGGSASDRREAQGQNGDRPADSPG